MKATGITRGVDELGRIVLPIELRRTLDIKTTDCLEIFVDGDCIVLRKYQRGCALCGNIEKNLTSFKGNSLCNTCKADIAQEMNASHKAKS